MAPFRQFRNATLQQRGAQLVVRRALRKRLFHSVRAVLNVRVNGFFGLFQPSVQRRGRRCNGNGLGQRGQDGLFGQTNAQFALQTPYQKTGLGTLGVGQHFGNFSPFHFFRPRSFGMGNESILRQNVANGQGFGFVPKQRTFAFGQQQRDFAQITQFFVLFFNVFDVGPHGILQCFLQQGIPQPNFNTGVFRCQFVARQIHGGD